MIDLDDVVFENRNKSYGACLLRKVYNTHMLAGGMSTIVVTVFLFVYTVAVGYSDDDNMEIVKVRYKSIVYTTLPVPPQVAPKAKTIKKPKPPAAAQKLKRQKKYSVSQQTKKLKNAIPPPARPKVKRASPSVPSVTRRINKKSMPVKSLEAKETGRLDSGKVTANGVSPGMLMGNGNQDSKIMEMRVSLHLKNVTLRRALREIEKLTGINFVYSRNHINVMGIVTVDAEDKNVIEVLEEILEPPAIEYMLQEDNFIVLVPRENRH